jgi:hypothetical protein
MFKNRIEMLEKGWEVALLKQTAYEKGVIVLVFQFKHYVVLLQIPNSERKMWNLQPVDKTYIKKVKGKAVPLQAWSGPEGSRKLRFPDFMTTAQDGCKVVSPKHRPPLPSGNTPGTHFCWVLG